MREKALLAHATTFCFNVESRTETRGASPAVWWTAQFESYVGKLVKVCGIWWERWGPFRWFYSRRNEASFSSVLLMPSCSLTAPNGRYSLHSLITLALAPTSETNNCHFFARSTWWSRREEDVLCGIWRMGEPDEATHPVRW